MPRYKLTASTYINDALRPAGQEVEYLGWPGSSLEPADDVAKRIKAKHDDARDKGGKLPKVPDLAAFADPPPVPEPAPQRAAVPVPLVNTQPEGASASAPAAPPKETVDIPADWHSLDRNKRRALAQKLGADAHVTVHEADALIAEHAAKGSSNG